MKLYADLRGLRARQFTQDVLALLWVVLWVKAGLWFYDLVNRLQEPGRGMEQAGDRFADTMEAVSREVSDVPLVGEPLGAPFEAASEAGRALEQAGVGQQEVVAQLAVWLGAVVALLPIVLVLALYLPQRWRWSREATAAHRFRLETGDLYLFALRAATTRPLDELRKVVPDPGTALASGDYEALARLELRSLGLRTSLPDD